MKTCILKRKCAPTLNCKKGAATLVSLSGNLILTHSLWRPLGMNALKKWKLNKKSTRNLSKANLTNHLDIGINSFLETKTSLNSTSKKTFLSPLLAFWLKMIHMKPTLLRFFAPSGLKTAKNFTGTSNLLMEIRICEELTANTCQRQFPT